MGGEEGGREVEGGGKVMKGKSGRERESMRGGEK